VAIVAVTVLKTRARTITHQLRRGAGAPDSTDATSVRRRKT